ncbi:MAG: hypothetical protein HY506_00915 [Candidatus Yanofskybacteria bacterium]|nr:hypothetical protein [Candidatus Yanofskybacteria bacterium]
MTTITIPKGLTKGEELVIIPRKVYAEFLRLQKMIPLVKLTSAQKRDFERARKEYKKGEYINLSQLERELGITRKK